MVISCARVCTGLGTRSLHVWFSISVLVPLSELFFYLIELLIMTTESNKSDSAGAFGSETEQHHSTVFLHFCDILSWALVPSNRSRSTDGAPTTSAIVHIPIGMVTYPPSDSLQFQHWQYLKIRRRPQPPWSRPPTTNPTVVIARTIPVPKPPLLPPPIPPGPHLSNDVGSAGHPP